MCIRDRYGDYPIWCSSPTIFPLVPGWDFWQYSHSARLEGYDGAQDRIDLNIFRGKMCIRDSSNLT